MRPILVFQINSTLVNLPAKIFFCFFQSNQQVHATPAAPTYAIYQVHLQELQELRNQNNRPPGVTIIPPLVAVIIPPPPAPILPPLADLIPEIAARPDPSAAAAIHAIPVLEDPIMPVGPHPSYSNHGCGSHGRGRGGRGRERDATRMIPYRI